MTRILAGALAGAAATAAMTIAMRHLARRLPSAERYPLPPRELIERSLPQHGGAGRRLPEALREDLTLSAHFAYGAASGALYGLLDARPDAKRGALYGLAVWAASYLGWIPRARLLASAQLHPWRRNLLMNAVHLVWGGVLGLSLRELLAAEREVFSAGSPRDSAGSLRDAGQRQRPTGR